MRRAPFWCVVRPTMQGLCGEEARVKVHLLEASKLDQASVLVRAEL